ncbi:hypothetical protein [Parapedobacter sp.]
MIGNTKTQLPKPFNPRQSKYEQQRLRKAHRKRAPIGPVIDHLKADHRVNRNFYKRIFGDDINIMLATAAFNFKKVMNKWKKSFLVHLDHLMNGWLKIIDSRMLKMAINQKPKLAF